MIDSMSDPQITQIDSIPLNNDAQNLNTQLPGDGLSKFSKFSKFGFRKNLKLKIILPILFLLLAAVAVVAGMVLVQSDQDLRQQAAGGAGYSCGDSSIMFLSSIPNSVPCKWAGRTFYKCGDGFRNAGTRQSPNCVGVASSPSTIVSCTSYADGTDLFSSQVTGSSVCLWRGEQRFQCALANGSYYKDGVCVQDCISTGTCPLECVSGIGLFTEKKNHSYSCLHNATAYWECAEPYINKDNTCALP